MLFRESTLLPASNRYSNGYARLFLALFFSFFLSLPLLSFVIPSFIVSLSASSSCAVIFFFLPSPPIFFFFFFRTESSWSHGSLPVISTAANAVQVEYSHYIKWSALLTRPPLPNRNKWGKSETGACVCVCVSQVSCHTGRKRNTTETGRSSNGV